MSILDVTEDQIFQTLGKGRDPNFKPIEKVRPVVVKPKKSYTSSQAVKAPPPQVAAPEPVKSVPAPQVDESMMKLAAQLNEMNTRMNTIQKMVKWYIVPQFVIVLVLVLALFVKS